MTKRHGDRLLPSSSASDAGDEGVRVKKTESATKASIGFSATEGCWLVPGVPVKQRRLRPANDGHVSLQKEADVLGLTTTSWIALVLGVLVALFVAFALTRDK